MRALRGGARWRNRSASIPRALKIVVFVYAALLAGVSGWLYAHLQRFVNPTPFGIKRASNTCSWRWSAAPGSVLGRACSAPAIVTCSRTVAGLPAATARRRGNFEIIVFGVLMVLLLQFARDGLWPLIAPAAAARAAGADSATPRHCRARRAPPTRGRC